MHQELSASITIHIPHDYILISKVEYKELKDQELSGQYWNMNDLEKRINKKYDWIKTHILYPQHFEEILNVKNGGFVYYPKSQGQSWSFHAAKMAKFLDEHFQEIFTI